MDNNTAKNDNVVLKFLIPTLN